MKKLNDKNTKMIHITIIILVIFISIVIAAIVMLKYQVEGEKNPPFKIANLMMVSTAEGTAGEVNEQNKWNLNINQNNDLYLAIDKNDNYPKKEVIKNIVIEKFNILKQPEIGNIKIYRPANEKLYKNEDEYLVKDKIEYKGSKQTSLKDLQISNQGGIILLRFENQNIGKYTSNDEEIIHDGTLISKSGIKLEQIFSEISFDIIIETGSNVKYKTTIDLKIPEGDIMKEGKGTFKKEDLSEVVFKRVKM